MLRTFLLLIFLTISFAATLKIRTSNNIDPDYEETTFLIKTISLTATANGLYKRIQRQESLPPNSFNLYIIRGDSVQKLIGQQTLLEQGITEATVLTLEPKIQTQTVTSTIPSTSPTTTSTASSSSTTTTSSTSTTSTTSTTSIPSVPPLKPFKVLPNSFVQGQNKGQLWHIIIKPQSINQQLQRRLISSSLVFDELYGDTVSWSGIKIIPDHIINAIEMGVPEMVRNMSQYSSEILSGPVPIRSDLGIPCDSPFGYGVMSAVSFWFRPWMNEDQHSAGNRKSVTATSIPKSLPTHESIFHTLPIQPGVLSPVLLLRNNRLFVGHASGRRGNNVDLRGQLTDVVINSREWHHLSLLFDVTSSTLQLYHNGALVGIPLRVHDDTHNLPFQKVAAIQRKLIFGSGTILQGAVGIVDHVLIHGGHAVSEIGNEYSNGYQYVEHLIPMWLDAVAWPHNDGNGGGGVIARTGASASSGSGSDSSEVVSSSSESIDSTEDQTGTTLYDLGMAILSAPPTKPPKIGWDSIADSSDTSDINDVNDINDENNINDNNDINSDDVHHSDWRVRTVARLKKYAKEKKKIIRQEKIFAAMTDVEIVEDALKRYAKPCVTLPTGWWTYELCAKKAASQKHKEPTGSETQILGRYDIEKTTKDRGSTSSSGSTKTRMVSETYTNGAQCVLEVEDQKKKEEAALAMGVKPNAFIPPFPRTTRVDYVCCPDLDDKYIDPHFLSVAEKPTCHYIFTICIRELCNPGNTRTTTTNHVTTPVQESTIAPSSDGVAPGTVETESTADPVVPYENVGLGAEGFASSVWSQLYIPEMAVDNAQDTMWKSTMKSVDKKPWVAIRWEKTCMSGIENVRLLWDLAPMAYSVSVGIKLSGIIEDKNSGSASGSHADEIPNVRWSECLDVARQATQGRTDLFLGEPCSLDIGKPINWLNISITHPGTWTAPSLKEIQVECRVLPKQNKESDKEHNNGGNENMGARVEEGESVEGSTIISEEEEETISLNNALSGLDEIMILMKKSKKDAAAAATGYPRDHRAALSAFALQVLVGSSSSSIIKGQQKKTSTYDVSESGAFLAIANHHYLGSPIDYVRRLLQLSNKTFAKQMYEATKSSCSASAALYWHEAKAAVGGNAESGIHPTPIQELKLSTADQDEINRHRGNDGDEGTYQLSAADSGDVNAQKWIATRFYHGLNGFPQDLPRAAEYFAAAGDAGDAEARYNYGVMRLTGQDGQPADPGVAHEHFERAAAQDFAPALNGLGIGHMGKANGISTDGMKRTRNFTAAAEFFRRAAKQNSADGHYNLGALYKDGQGVPRNVPAAMMHFVLAAMLGQHRAQWMLGNALHTSNSFLANYLSSYKYSSNKTKFEMEDVAEWKNKIKFVTHANASFNRIYANISGHVVDLPLKMSCDWAIEYLRPLAETRSAGEAFRNGVQSYLKGAHHEAERHFQASAWMGLSVGASNAAWMLRQDKRGATETEVLWPTTREEHSFSYSVIAAQRGDSIEHVAVANALSNSVEHLLLENERNNANPFPPLSEVVSMNGNNNNEVFSTINEESYPEIDLRRIALAAWEGASIVGCPEATVEMGMKYLLGDPSLSIVPNETLATEYLESCVSKYGEKVTVKFSTECVPAQMILWYLDGKHAFEMVTKWWKNLDMF